MNIGIIGSGSYGVALLSSLVKSNNITLYTRFKEEEEYLLKNRKSPKIDYLIPSKVEITSDKELLKNKDLIIIAIPTEGIDLIKELKPFIKSSNILIATKGITNDGYFVYEIVKNILNTNKVGIISGPSFANDVIKGYPIGLSLACKSNNFKNICLKVFKNTNIKLRPTKDMIGISICGSIKNVVAIAAGILDALNCPMSTKAMLVTESLHDIKNLIKLLGGSSKTFTSFAGFGDMTLTCSSIESRNYTYGKYLVEKDKAFLEEYRKNTTIEGLYTLNSIYKLLKNKKISIPLIDIIYEIVYKNKNSEKLLTFLLEKE